MARQREWRCACGYALLLQTASDGALRFYDDANGVSSCPRCSRDLHDVATGAAAAGAALALLERARAGEPLDGGEQRELAAALGLEPVVLAELLEQVRDRRQTVLVAHRGQLHRLNGAPPA